MICQRAVCDTLTDKRGNRYQAAVTKTELVGAAPYLAEKDVALSWANLGANSPNWSCPAVCTIFSCAITWIVKTVNTVIKIIRFMMLFTYKSPVMTMISVLFCILIHP